MTASRAFFLLLCCAATEIALDHSVRAVNVHSIYRQNKDSAEVTVVGANPDADHVEVSLSGTISVTLQVKGLATLEVEKADAIVASDKWKERRRQPAQETQGVEYKYWQQQFTLEPQLPGDLILSLAPLRYRQDPNDAWQTIAWDPIPVKVTTEIGQADPKELRDIVLPEPASQVQPGYPWRAWTGLGLIAVALILGIWEIKRRVARTRPTVPPEKWAIKELGRIREMNLPAEREGIKHHALVAEVLRSFFELRFQITASGKTTSEFLETVQRGECLTPQQFTMLSDALNRCDLAKFAHVDPTREECSQMEQCAETLVRQTTRGRD